MIMLMRGRTIFFYRCGILYVMSLVVDSLDVVENWELLKSQLSLTPSGILCVMSLVVDSLDVLESWEFLKSQLSLTPSLISDTKTTSLGSMYGRIESKINHV